MSAQAVLEEPSVVQETVQFYEFGFEAVPGGVDPLPPAIQVIGPPSLTALVTKKEAQVLLTLTQQGLPEGTQVYFDVADPICWHPFGHPEPCDKQPEWVVALMAKKERITFTIDNPATALRPIVAAFTPRIFYQAPGACSQPVLVPDPTIVNIDPTGG